MWAEMGPRARDLLWIAASAMLGACDFPTPSAGYACETTADCDPGRVCTTGYCVVGREAVDGPLGQGQDAAPESGADAAPPPPDADPFPAIAQQCQAVGYTLVAGGYYRSVGSGQPWLGAQADCANDVPGATHLIVLSTAAEVAYMQAQRGWIGLSDRVTEGTFVTVTGETGDLRPWESGQPDNGSGSEDCVQMKQGLDDDQCNNDHRYVCECDGRASTP